MESVKNRMKKHLKLIISLSAATIVGIGTYLYACADEGWYYLYNSVFSPEVTVNKTSYTPLYLEGENLFYGDYDTDSQGNLSSSDLDDWKQYLGKDFWAEGIQYFMYNNDALADIRKYNDATDKSSVRLSHHTPKNQNARLTNFFVLLDIARNNESITNNTESAWDYEKRNVQYTQNSQIEKAEKLYQKAVANKDTFFANRMWLQVMRLKFYSANRSAVIAYFEQTQAGQPKNSVYYRALHYVAGAYKSQKNYTKANALLATLFSEVPKLRKTVTFEYHALTDSETEKIAASLSKAEQCALWAMQGYYSKEEVAIQKILHIDPKSPHIDFLLTRYINRIEGVVNKFGDLYQNQPLTNATAYHQYTHKVATQDFKTDWLLQTAREGKVGNPYLWNVAAGYVSMFRNEATTAKEFLKKADAVAKNEKQKVQVRIIDVMNDVTALQQITAADEERLTKKVEWMWQSALLKESEYKSALRSRYAFDLVRNYLSALYNVQKNLVMSEITRPKDGFYENNNHSAAIEKFLLKTNKTPWEVFWAKEYRFTLGEIYESRAIYAFYKDDLDKAIAEMKKIPLESQQVYDEQAEKMVSKQLKLSESSLPANPFNGYIQDCHDCEHAKKRSPYTKISFLQKVKEMEDKLAKGEDMYNNALLLGNAFYSASYFGNSRAFYYNDILGEAGGFFVNAQNMTMLLNMTHAKKYYQIAQQHASTDEQRAKIAYMLAKVERNEFYNKQYYSEGKIYGVSPWENEIAFKDWQGFKELRKYPHTQYYKDVIRECGYFRKVTGNK